MERLNWAVLGLMGIVTALGLTTSSGAGKAKSETTDSDTQVVVCAPIGADTVISHSGCAHCQAKKDATANDVAKPADDSSEIEKAFSALIRESGITKIEGFKSSLGGLYSEEQCPGNCHETGVCCDKSLGKGTPAVAAKPLTANKEPHFCEGGECPSCKKASTDVVTADCPLTKAADAITNLTKNHVCEGGECLTKQGQGTLTITTVDSTPAKPEGLSNLLAAAAAVKTDQPAGTITVDELPANEITFDTEPILTTAEGLKAIEALSKNKPAPAATAQPAVKAETRAAEPSAEAKPVSDNSRAAARAAKLAALEKRMAEEISFNLNQNKLDDIVEQLRVEKRIEVQLDRRALEEMAFDTASPFDYVINNIECGEALRTMLHAKRLTWIIPEGNDMVLITSESAAETTLLPRVYEVSDLTDEPGVLMERIQAIVNPERWKANGGQNDLAVWQSGEQAQLAVNCDFWTHRKLANFLDDLRAARAASPKRLAQAPAANVPSLRTYNLPIVFTAESKTEERNQKLNAMKCSLLQVLKSTAGFSEETFETLEVGVGTVLVTKQLPAVHQEIERVFKLLKQHEGFGGCSSIIPVVGSRTKAAGGFFSVAP